MQINPGVFNKKIEIIKYQTQKDSDGFEEKEEAVVLMTWAQVTNISGTELIKNNSEFAEIKTRFLIRTPNKVIEKNMFIKFRGNIYNILYINDYSYDKKYTEIMAELVMK